MLTHRARKGIYPVLLIFLLVLWVSAVDVIINGDFVSNINNWTEVELQNPANGQTIWDAAGSPNGTGGALRHETITGRRDLWEGYSYQNITEVQANSTGTLSFDWKGEYRQTTSQAYFDLYAEIVRPGGNVTTVWTQQGAPVSWSTWFSVVDLDVSSVLNETGNYSLRLRSYLRTGNDASAQTLSFWDVVSLNITPPDTTPPSVNLSSPAIGSWPTTDNVTLYFNISDDSGFRNCSVYVNGTLNSTNTSTLINNAMNNVTVENLTDGFYNWSVACVDTSIFFNTNSSAVWNFSVDTTPPNVSLESPPNNTLNTTHNTVTIYYNVSDAAVDVTSCSLVIDGTTDQTDPTSPLPEQQSLNFTTTLTNGDHNWSVNCTDANGWVGTSVVYNISILTASPTVVSDKSAYDLGETVAISGDNWGAVQTVTLNISLNNGTIILWNTTSDGSGSITDSYFINYSHPYGLHNLSAIEYDDPDKNATTDFTVNTPVIILTLSSNESVQGNWIDMNATGFAPDHALTLNVSHGTADDLFNLTTNSTGGFYFHYTVSYTADLQSYNVTASNDLFPDLNQTGQFNVTQRTANLSTDKETYGQNEIVNITGFFYTNNGTVELVIKDNDTQVPIGIYPKDVFANGTGFINDEWDTGSICAGNFTVEAYDQNHTFLNASAFFNITRDIVARNNDSLPASVVGSNVVASLAAINESDNTTQNLGLTGANQEYYLEVNFLDTLPAEATIDAATLFIEHERDDSKVQSYQVWWLNTTSGLYQAAGGTGCSGAPPDSPDTTDQCDLSDLILTYQDAQDMTVRLNYTRSGAGGPSDAYVDYTHLQIDFQEPGPCSVPNNAPSVQAVDILSQTNLVAGTTALVLCNLSVYDGNGGTNVSGANATFYYYPNESTHQDDNATHYTNASCQVSSTNAYVRNFTCSFSVLYYARNGTWSCNGTATDGIAWESAENTTTVTPLYAMNLTDILDYGDVEAGVVSPDTVLNVTNFGNMDFDISVFGFGVNPGDGLALNCTTGNITLDNERYNLSSGVPFADMAPLTSTAVNLSHFNMVPRTDTNTSFRETFWKLYVEPPLERQVCNGTITVEAILDE